MNINEVKTSIKVADVILSDDGSSWNINWNKDIAPNILINECGRIYLIVSNGIIKKIGGSSSKGGIKNTMSSYKGGSNGRPSLRTFGINSLILEELLNENKIEIHLIISESIEAPVKGLFDVEYMNISSFKEMEDKCKNDYKSIEGKYPDWNFQENVTKFPDRIYDKYIEQLNKSNSLKS